MNGTAGEHASLSVAERKALGEAWVREGKAAGLTSVILHVGAGSLGDSRELAAHAEGLGADAVAAIAPTYYKPPDLGTRCQAKGQMSKGNVDFQSP